MDTAHAGPPPVAAEDGTERPASEGGATVGQYTWQDFLAEYGDDVAGAVAGTPKLPSVPASAVKTRIDEPDASIVRGSGVERPFRADGDTHVEGAGTPDDGSLIVDADDVVVSGDAVIGTDADDDAADPDGDDTARSGSAVVVAGEAVEPMPAAAAGAPDWDRASIDPTEFLGFHPVETEDRFRAAEVVAATLRGRCADRYDLHERPVLKGYYTWDDYEEELFLDENGDPPTDDAGEPREFTHGDKTDALGFDPDRIGEALAAGGTVAAELDEVVDERTVDVDPDIDEDAFFTTADGTTTLANRYDLEKAVPLAKMTHFREEERYWVNEPYAFVVVFRSTKENEPKYYAVQPYRTRIETDLVEFLTGKLRTTIKYADESIAGGDESFREGVIAEETRTLLDRYELYEDATGGEGFVAGIVDMLGLDSPELDSEDGIVGRIAAAVGDRFGGDRFGSERPTANGPNELSGISVRPEPAVLAEDPEILSEYQVEKLLYYLKRDFIGYERIDPIKHDINVEDISCDGYESPVFVYHADYEQIISNVHHGTEELDDFVVKLAQRSGKGISKRRPQVDATLPDGSRAQLTLGTEVSDHGTNYTIRQFNDIPFTPVDLINWKTFSLDQMAFLWLCIENNKNLIFAGGTASGKTTSLNAVSLFIPSNAKIVSIEDTREVELPQRNWIASVTRPSFSDDDKGDVDEFDLLEAALRQRPDYIVMGEIRGEEGRTAFQVMSTGHTTYTTFHADSVGEVLKRFTTDPINVSKTMFTALDLVSIQASTRVQGRKVRRNKSLTEINHYDAENDEINVQDIYQWQAETDEFLRMGDSNVLEEIMFDRGWGQEKIDDELRKRRVVLAYLIDRDLNSYAQVAATFQAFINDPETVLALMANDGLERSLEDLREMESVHIDVDREKEAMVPRPDPDEEGREEAAAILAKAEDLFERYRGTVPDGVADALLEIDPDRDVAAQSADEHESLTETAPAAEASTGGDEADPSGSPADPSGASNADGAPKTVDALDAGRESDASDGSNGARNIAAVDGLDGAPIAGLDEPTFTVDSAGRDRPSTPDEGAADAGDADETEVNVDDDADVADAEAAAEASAAADATDADGDTDDDADGIDPDDWGFESVEPAEEEG